MSKPSKLAGAKTKHTISGIPFVVIVGLIGLGLLGYVLSQAVTAAEAHPSHWLAALVGAILGGLLGWLWYRWRGDII